MELTKSELITKVLQYAYNVTLEKFTDDLKTVIDSPFVSYQYAEEKFDRMRGNFITFYCDLDDEAKERFVQVALKHYGLA